MGKKKYTTRKQRQANNGKIEQTQRFENNAQGITASLEHIKNQNQYINSAIGEIGTVSPGNGLMLGQASNTMVEYQNQYHEFVEFTIKPKLRKLAESKIQIRYRDEIVNKEIHFYRQDDKLGENALILKDNNLHEKKHYTCGEVSIVEMRDGREISRNNIQTKNNDERQLLRFVIQEFLNDYNSLTSKEFDSLPNNTYTLDKVIERLDNFSKRDALLGFKLQGMSTNCISRINSSTTATSPSERNLNLTQAAAGLTTIISSMAASLLTNSTTTPTISYNSTNTSIIDTNYNTTTSKPEQGDSIDKGYIPVIIGVPVIMGMFFYFIGRYCWKKTRPSGKYNVQEKEHFTKFKNIDNDFNNSVILLRKEETTSLLSNNEQPPASPHEPPDKLNINELQDVQYANIGR